MAKYDIPVERFIAQKSQSCVNCYFFKKSECSLLYGKSTNALGERINLVMKLNDIHGNCIKREHIYLLKPEGVTRDEE